MPAVSTLIPALATLAVAATLLVPRRRRRVEPSITRTEPLARPDDATPTAAEPADLSLLEAADLSLLEASDLSLLEAADPSLLEAADHGERSADVPLRVPTDMRSPAVQGDRIVPLTRLPLRRHAAVAWPSRLSPGREALTPDARHALLVELGSRADAALEPILIAATREEDGPGRLLALRGLTRVRSEAAQAVFEEALRSGTDEERSLAVDALLARGAFDAVGIALTDRVDAIAARAALGLVRSRSREDYVATLAGRLEPARLDVLLALLAGYVE